MGYIHDVKEIRNFINEIKNLNTDKFEITDYFNLSKLSKEDVLSISVDLTVFVHGSGYGNKLLYVDDKTFLSEGVEKTMPIEEVKKELLNKLKLKEWQIVEDCRANNVKLIILYVDYGINEEIILSEMQACGWSKSYITNPTQMYGQTVKAISFDPMFQPNVNEEARSFKTLFHWTPIYNVELIRENGLIPKSENGLFDYPPHVHLMKGNITDDQRMYLGWQLCRKNHNQLNKGTYSLFEVNTAAIPENVDFFYDPRYEFGYYTKEIIPKEALKELGMFQFK